MPPKRKRKPQVRKNTWTNEEHNAICQLLQDKRAEEEEEGLDCNVSLTGAALWDYIAERLSEHNISSTYRFPHECRLYWTTSGRRKSGFDERPDGSITAAKKTADTLFEALPLLERVIKKLQQNPDLRVKNPISPTARYFPKRPNEATGNRAEWDAKSPVVCICQWKDHHAGMPCIGCSECYQFKHIPCLVQTGQIGVDEAYDPRYRYMCSFCKAKRARARYGDPKDGYFRCSCYYSIGTTKPCVRCMRCGVYRHLDCMVRDGEVGKEYEALEEGFEYVCRFCKWC